MNFYNGSPPSYLSRLLPFIGVLIGASITALVSYKVNAQLRRTNLYEAVFNQKFEAAVKLTTEAEYLRRGLAEYQLQNPNEKVGFKKRWLATAFDKFSSGVGTEPYFC